MRVAVVNLTSGGLSGGYVKYLETLIPLLAADARVSDLKLYYPPGARLPDIRAAESLRWSGGRASLRDTVSRDRPDVVFIPTQRWVGFGDVPTAVMVRNMEPLEVPFQGNTLLESLRNLARRRAAHAACRQATAVVAVSDHVRDFLVQEWRVSPDRITRIYHGVQPVTDDMAEQTPAAFLDWGNLEPFLFIAGSIRPARGIEDAVSALPALVRKHDTLKLVVAGSLDKQALPYRRRIDALAARLGVGDRVTWLGALNRAEMAWYFRKGAVFLMTSRAEACPNTLLEAMSHGSRIVSVTTPPMPEFLRSTATFYGPRDTVALAERIATALDDPADRTLRDATRARARDFSWESTARQTIDLLHKLSRGRLH